VFGEIEVEAFASRRAFDEPVDRLGRVRDVLRDRHHVWLRTICGVGFIENPGGSLEEFLAAD
jgi:hypothetical protein